MINIIFKDYPLENERTTVKCLKNEKFGSVKRKFEKITSNQCNYIRYAFDLREIDTFDDLKWSALKYKTLEDLGLNDNSIIVYSEKCLKCIKTYFKI